jgi:hypothetical protein
MQMYMQNPLVNAMHIHTSAQSAPSLFFSLHRLIRCGDRGSKRLSGQPSPDLSEADKHSALHRDITTYSDMETLVTRHRCKQPKNVPNSAPLISGCGFNPFSN